MAEIKSSDRVLKDEYNFTITTTNDVSKVNGTFPSELLKEFWQDLRTGAVIKQEGQSDKVVKSFDFDRGSCRCAPDNAAFKICAPIEMCCDTITNLCDACTRACTIPCSPLALCCTKLCLCFPLGPFCRPVCGKIPCCGDCSEHHEYDSMIEFCWCITFGFYGALGVRGCCGEPTHVAGRTYTHLTETRIESNNPSGCFGFTTDNVNVVYLDTIDRITVAKTCCVCDYMCGTKGGAIRLERRVMDCSTSTMKVITHVKDVDAAIKAIVAARDQVRASNASVVIQNGAGAAASPMYQSMA